MMSVPGIARLSSVLSDKTDSTGNKSWDGSAWSDMGVGYQSTTARNKFRSGDAGLRYCTPAMTFGYFEGAVELRLSLHEVSI